MAHRVGARARGAHMQIRAWRPRCGNAYPSGGAVRLHTHDSRTPGGADPSQVLADEYGEATALSGRDCRHARQTKCIRVCGICISEYFAHVDMRALKRAYAYPNMRAQRPAATPEDRGGGSRSCGAAGAALMHLVGWLIFF